VRLDGWLRPKYFYGYVNSACAGVALFFLGGANYLLPAMAGFMKDDLGWSATATGGAFSVYYVVFGGVTMLSGALIARFGPRFLIWTGALMVLISSLLLSMTQALWHLYLLAAAYSVGVSAGGVTPGPQLAGNWLHRRRGLVIGLLLAGTGLGGSVLTIVGERVMVAYGSWRLSWLVIAGIMLVSILLAGIFVRNEPKEVGQNIDGVKDPEQLQRTESGRPRGAYKSLVAWTIGEAARTPTLWLIVLTFGVSDYVFLGTLSHQVTYLTGEAGVSASVAAGALALMVASMTIGKASGGWLADRVEPRKTLGLMSLMLAAGLLVLLLWHATPALYLYVILLGVGFGGSMSQTSATLANYYGCRNLAGIMGLAHGTAVLLGALSTTLTGVIRDAAGSYVPAFIVMLVLAVAGAVFAFSAPIPQWKPVAQRKPVVDG
jgi:MFS family permease